MKFYKLLIISGFTAASLVACGSNSGSKTKLPKEGIKSETSYNNNASEKATIHLNRAEFLARVYNFEKSPDKWVYNGDKPAIVDFYADWCGPCKQVAPILEELAAKYKGEIYIYKIDTDAEQQLAGEFGITAIPTLMFIPQQGKPQVTQGALSKAQLENAIETILMVKKK